MVKVKICGITNLADALAAIRSGAEMLGFVFAESPRRIPVNKAAAIIRGAGIGFSPVGVFVDEDLSEVRRIMSHCRLAAVQLHGSEPAGYIRRLRAYVPVIKAVRIGDESDVGSLEEIDADAVLVDSKSDRAKGGTGQAFDWELLAERKISLPLIVSGGLRPENVRQAVKRFRPFAVDASSGVERKPGLKDHEKVRSFIENAKSV